VSGRGDAKLAFQAADCWLTTDSTIMSRSVGSPEVTDEVP
jgi:hypothetical protein